MCLTTATTSECSLNFVFLSKDTKLFRASQIYSFHMVSYLAKTPCVMQALSKWFLKNMYPDFPDEAPLSVWDQGSNTCANTIFTER